MKIKITTQQRKELTQLHSDLAEKLTAFNRLIADREQMLALLVASKAEAESKQGTYDLTDDKEVLAHLIRTQRYAQTQVRLNWLSATTNYTAMNSEEIYDEVVPIIGPHLAALVDSLKEQITTKLTHSVGEEEAARLAELSEPVQRLNEQVEKGFIQEGDNDSRLYPAIGRIAIVIQHILGDDHGYELLKKRLAEFDQNRVPATT